MTTGVYLVFATSSFSVVGTSTYNQLVQNWLRDQPQYTYNVTTLARNGNNSWSSLVRLSGALTADTQTVIIDTANDDNTTIDKAALEAIIRRVWTYNPLIRIVGVSSPSWNSQDTSNDLLVTTPTNLTEVNNAKAIFTHYSTSYAAYLDAVIALVQAGTRHLNELTTDTVHPSATYGHPLMASLVEAFLPSSGAQLSGALPAYHLADTADFVHDPIVRLGTDNDGTTGTWTTTGSKIESTETGATVVFTGTFRSIGCYRVDGGTNVVEADVDSGGFGSITFNHAGYDIGTRGVHTVTIRVPAGGNCEIDEFWAI